MNISRKLCSVVAVLAAVSAGITLTSVPDGAVASNAPAAAAASSYVRVSIPAVNISSSAYPTGAVNGALQVPAAVDRLFWYDKSARFEDKVGDMVIAGHVSDNSDRPGSFYRLKSVRVGNVINVVKGGVTHKYKVTDKDTFSRARALPDSVFSMSGYPRLILVTCTNKVTNADGSFHYRDNLVVRARLVK